MLGLELCVHSHVNVTARPRCTAELTSLKFLDSQQAFCVHSQILAAPLLEVANAVSWKVETLPHQCLHY